MPTRPGCLRRARRRSKNWRHSRRCARSLSAIFPSWEFSELKIPYDTVGVADFADSECGASAKSCYSVRAWNVRVL
ncbi:hypothetical protein DWX64_15240 [Clostridium sp. AF20-17LB]|nr:hypothetical protein DWX64_15240 [Clostridium sp. AF20-17LB]